MVRGPVHLFLLTLLAGAAVAQELEETIHKLLEAPAAAKAFWAIHAVDLKTGNVLYTRNANVPMTPASNTKLISTSLALLRLGPEHRFETRVMGSQKPDAAGRLAGGLSLIGGGDPVLSARQVPYQKGINEGDPLVPLADLADQVAKSGLRVVDGDLVGDDTLYPWIPYPDGWSVGDLTWEYGAPVSALTFNDNAQAIHVRPGQAAGDPASIRFSPPIEYFSVLNTLRTSAGATRRIEIDRLPGSRVLTLNGALAPSSAGMSQLIAIDDPALFAAMAFRNLLEQRGVVIRGAVETRHRAPGRAYEVPAGALLARRESPPLGELLKIINKVSQNLHAEIVLREVARVRRADATAEEAHKETAELLAGLHVPKDEFVLEDGSGLSRRTLISPAAIVRLLEHMYRSERRDIFWNTLPIAGEDGTLSGRFRGVTGAAAIRAKTGSLSHVAALSGYAGLDADHRAALSIIVNNYTAPASEVRAVIDRMALAILQSIPN